MPRNNKSSRKSREKSGSVPQELYYQTSSSIISENTSTSTKDSAFDEVHASKAAEVVPAESRSFFTLEKLVTISTAIATLVGIIWFFADIKFNVDAHGDKIKELFSAHDDNKNRINILEKSKIAIEKDIEHLREKQENSEQRRRFMDGYNEEDSGSDMKSKTN